MALVACVTIAGSAVAETRVALVIGNAAYKNATTLANPRNDARAVAEKLRGIGFDVSLYEDLDGQAFRTALGAFTEKALNADLAVVFYAGHGIEMNGQNYLIPIDAQMKSEATAQFEAIPLEQVLSAVREAGKLGMVMLDACRNNPFATSMKRSSGTRAVSRGLAPVSVEGEKGLLVSFAAEAGSTADDGDTQHSPYTAALLEVLDQPGLEVGRMFRSVRAKVKDATGGKQVPIEQMQLPDEDIYLVAGAAAAPIAAPTANIAPMPAAVEDPLLMYLAALQAGNRAQMEDFIRRYPDHVRAPDARAWVEDRADADFWASTTAQDTADGYRAYLLGFPQGRYRAEADARILALAPPPPAPDPVPLVQDTAYLGSCPALNGGWSVSGIAIDDTLFVRAGPGTSNPEVGELAYNADGVMVGNCSAAWCAVQYGCISGYASQKYLTERNGGHAPSAFSGLYSVVGHPADQLLNIRSGPGTQYEVVAELVPNAIDIVVTDCQAVAGYDYRWCNLSWNNVSGWGYGRYLQNGQGNNPVPNIAPTPAASGGSCFDLWYERNSIFAARGYCFTSTQGKKHFDNSQCYTDTPDLTASEKQRVNDIKAFEAAKGC